MCIYSETRPIRVLIRDALGETPLNLVRSLEHRRVRLGKKRREGRIAFQVIPPTSIHNGVTLVLVPSCETEITNTGTIAVIFERTEVKLGTKREPYIFNNVKCEDDHATFHI